MALLYIALPSFKEAEGYDRPDLDLTEQQVALIKAVGKVQPQNGCGAQQRRAGGYARMDWRCCGCAWNVG